VIIDPVFLDGSGDYQAPAPGTVGARHRGAAVKIGGPGAPCGPAADLQPMLTLPPAQGAELAGLTWPAADASPLEHGSAVHPEATITGRRFGDDDVVIDTHVLLAGGAGQVVRQAQVSWRAPRSAVPGPDPSTDAIASPPWGAALAARLGSDPAFASSASTFDGSIGFASRTGAGLVAVELRIYRGKIIETGRKSLDGPTYALEADALTWAELVTGQYDDYVRLAARGLFTVRGSGFQYLRLTKTLRIMVWHARQMRQEARHG
jgi:hypothetical protein